MVQKLCLPLRHKNGRIVQRQNSTEDEYYEIPVSYILQARKATDRSSTLRSSTRIITI